MTQTMGMDLVPAGSTTMAKDGGGPPPELLRGDQFAPMVEEFWRACQRETQAARRDYWINLAFYLAEQWLWWDDVRNMPQRKRQTWSPLGKGRVRYTFNRFGPNLLNLLGRLSKSELAFEVVPSGVADNLAEGARRGEKVLDGWKSSGGIEARRFDELLGCFLGGTSAILVEWDGSAGSPIGYKEGSGQVVGIGEAKVRSLNINEFGIEPGVRDYMDATRWVMGLQLPVKAVQRWFDLKWCPRPDSWGGQNAMRDILAAGTGRATGDTCLVLCYYERPHRREKGRYICVVNGVTVGGGPKPWPFPWTEPNIHLFRQKVIDGRAYGSTLCNDAMPIQVAYNFARSVLGEHMKLAGNARLAAPFGSIDEEDIHDSAGSILWYSPDLGGNVPGYIPPPNLPRWLTAEAQALAAELDDAMHVHDINRGQGFDRASASGLALLSEKDDTALGRMVTEQKLGWERIGSQVLQLYGEKATETRTTQLRAAPGIPNVITWTGKQLMGQYDVVVPRDAVEPRTHAQRALVAKDLWDRHIITDPRIYARQVGLPADQFEQLLDADAAKAHRENFRMELGYVEIPEDFDDHKVHIAEHNRYRVSDSYKYAEPEIRQMIDDHVMYHEQKAASEFAKQAARAATSPAVAALPQASAPDGSNVPLPGQEQAALAAAMAGGGGGGPAPIAALPPGAAGPPMDGGGGGGPLPAAEMGGL